MRFVQKVNLAVTLIIKLNFSPSPYLFLLLAACPLV